MNINLDTHLEYILDTTVDLISIPSPVGFTDVVMDRVAHELDKFRVPYKFTKKGAIIGYIEGEDNSYKKMISAHLDTLGAVVKKIKSNGRLELINVGGCPWAGVEGENLTVHTLDGREYEGTLLPIKSSVHIYGDVAREMPRTAETMEVRLDYDVKTAEDTAKLGIRVGDFISYETRTRITDTGYIKSRYLDDKLCVAQILGYIKVLKDYGLKPRTGLYIYFSNYEEIGHGVSVIPEDLDEFIALDIGLVGEDALGDEKKVSIAAKDFKTPYDLHVRRGLMEAAEEAGVQYTVDVYNRYGSDASAAVLQGFDFRCGCIGPSVNASHHYERTHVDGVMETVKLMLAYL